VIFSFTLVLVATVFAKVHLDPVALGISVVVTALRGIGLVRLFLFKKDSWIYLGSALLILFVSDASDLVFGGTDFFLERHHLFATVVSYVLAAMIIVYAFRIGNKDTQPKA
jgi:hypothetical protein